MTHPETDPEVLSGNKIVRTFRMPRDLVYILGREATQRGLDLTALVLKVLQGYTTYFSLPEAAIAQLEVDRSALKMDRNQYLAHILYHRCLAIREQGLGFDDPYNPLPRKQGFAEDDSPSAQSAKDAPAERTPAPTKPLGSAGGGAHQASGDLIPGAGLWPYGVPKKPPPRR